MVKRAKTEKLSITLPRELVEEIRGITPVGGISGFFFRAARHYIAQERFLRAIEVGYGAWKDENHPDLVTPEDTLSFLQRLRGLEDGQMSPLDHPHGQ